MLIKLPLNFNPYYYLSHSGCNDPTNTLVWVVL